MWTEDIVCALLQIASKGRVTWEDRAHLPAELDTLGDAALLAVGQRLEALAVRYRWSPARLAALGEACCCIGRVGITAQDVAAGMRAAGRAADGRPARA